ncbi:MAG: hypothetical protein WCV84_00855 [Patescibacteria group bacterium]
MPMTVKLVLLLWAGATDMMKAVLGGAVLGIITVNLLSPSHQPTRTLRTALLSELASILILVIFVLYTKKWVATWHAAEHMAADVWWRNRSTSLEAVAAGDRIQDACGGRLFLPLFLTVKIAAYVAMTLQMSQWLFYLVGLEAALQVEHWIGWSRVPGVQRFNRWLQRNISTAPPGAKEIETAHVALICLIYAEEKADEATP